MYYFTSNERNEYQLKCEKIFEELFGTELLSKYKKSIQLIFEMQLSKKDILEKNLEREMNNRGKDAIEKFLQQGEIPLEDLKLIFNSDIINNNSPELIEQYLQYKNDKKNVSTKFRTIIENAYGKSARDILESRPNLNVHSINSLEVFNKAILDEFGEAFVHDCISYNLRDFSSFLHIIKNHEKSKDFKLYYDTLSEIYGKNIETIQKAISEFHSVENLFKNAKNVELTDRQYSNLISVICARNNPHKISSLEELQHYDEIVISSLKKQTKDPQCSIDSIKNLICQQILEIDYYSYSDYGKDINFLNKLYNIQQEQDKKELYDEKELNMLNSINFILNENNIEKLYEFIEGIAHESKKGIQTPVVLHTALEKMIKNQTRILNNSLTSIEKLDEEYRKNGSELFIEEKDGIKYYHLNGESFVLLATDTGAFDKEMTVSYEGQAANNTICCRLLNSKNGNIDISRKQLFFNILPDMIIAAENGDANTQHVSKRVKNRGRVTTNITKIPELDFYDNEVAINRHYQDHRYISNYNRGGRVIPDAYGIIAGEKLSDEEITFCKKYNIPIFVCHADKYAIKNQFEETNKTLIEEQEGAR